MAKTIDFARNLVFFVFLAFIIWLIIFIVGRDFPMLGHDYRIHLPRMLDTHLHYLINGPTIQWYTPSFGSGLPAYPDPLYIHFSLPQFLLFRTDPWCALMVSLAVYGAIGAIGFYYFLKNVLELTWLASILGAIFIVANGFYLEHMIVGHIGYQQFPLLGLILLLLFSKKLNFLQVGVVLGLLGTLMIHQAGFYLVVIFGLSLSLTLPLLYLIRPSLFEWRKLLLACLTGSMLTLFLSLSKLSAIFSFMRFFPRHIEDDYGKTYIEGLGGILSQLAGGMTLIPFYLANMDDTNQMTEFLQKATGSIYGIWETDISLSPAIFLLLIVSIIYGCFQINKLPFIFTKKKRIACLILLLGLWLTLDFSLAQGWLYDTTKALPIVKSLHVNVRFAAAFIFPASLLAAYGFHHISHQLKPAIMTVFFLLLVSITILPFGSYLVLDKIIHLRTFNTRLSLETYDFILQGKLYTTTEIATLPDDRVFKYKASNLGELNNAIFGYYLEDFHPETKPGSVFETSNGYYNMTNPASYVFPEENGLYTFERFRVDQRDELELFIHRKQPDWEMSPIQHASNICSLVALIVVALYLLSQFIIAGINVYKSVKSFIISTVQKPLKDSR